MIQVAGREVERHKRLRGSFLESSCNFLQLWASIVLLGDIMKRAMTILFWVQLLAIPCGVWAQEETEIPWYLQEEVRKETGNDNPRGTTSLGMPITHL